jgi:LuxR family maltose regulon positive regulatory protein
VVGAGAGQALLEEALRCNLFLVPLGAPPSRWSAGNEPAAEQDPERELGGWAWYRYHHLFREALLQRLRAAAGEMGVRALRACAGEWLADHGLVEEAVPHFLAAGDAAGAAAVVAACAPTAFDQQKWMEVERWLALLPEAVVQPRPALLLARAWVAMFLGQYGDISPLLAAAEELLNEADEAASAAEEAGRTALRGEVDALTCIVRLQQNDPSAALVAGRRALERLPAERTLFRAYAIHYLGFATLLIDGPIAALQHLNLTLAAAGGAHDLPGLRAMVTISLVYLYAGALHNAQDTALEALHLPAAHPVALVSGFAQLLLGTIAYELNELSAAETYLQRVAHESPQITFPTRRDGVLGLALVYLAQGRVREAWDAVHQLVDLILRTGNADYLPPVRAFQARLWLRLGGVEQARDCLRSLLTPGRIGHLRLVDDPALTHAKLMLADGTPDGLRHARAYLDVLHASAVEQHLTLREIEIVALQALAASADGDHPAAVAALERALALAEPGGFVRTFVDLGLALAPLLREVSRRQPHNAYPRRLLEAIECAEPSPERPGDDGQWRDGPPGALDAEPVHVSSLPAGAGPNKLAPADAVDKVVPIERLTYREEEVLACLLRRLSNKEIARELCISPATVKRHASNVYAKLGVGTRREAERRTRELGLLSA